MSHPSPTSNSPTQAPSNVVVVPAASATPTAATDATPPRQKPELARLRQLARRQPHNVQRRLQLVHALYHTGQHAQAVAELASLLDKGRKRLSFDDLCTAASLLMALGQHRQAQTLFESLARQRPDNLDAALGLARAHLHLAQPGQALKVLDSAANLPGAADHASWHFLVGSAHLLSKSWPAAARHLARAVELDPTHAHALNNFGVVLKEGLGRGTDALPWFERALQADPDFIDAAVNYAAVQMNGDNDALEAAYTALLRFWERKPNHALYWHALAQVQHRRRQWTQARALYDLALRLDPHNADLLTNVGLWYFDQKQYEQAVEWFTKALQAAPDHPDALEYLGVSYAHLGHLEQQVPLLEQLLQQNPSARSLRFQLAWNMLGLGEFELGFRLYLSRPSRHEVHAAPNGTPYATVLPLDHIAGDRLLLVADQGIGDEWFFLRFAPALLKHGATLHYWTPSKLAPLVRRLGWFEEVWTELPPADAFDAAINVGDLPMLLGMQSGQTPPPPIPLEPLPEMVQRAELVLRAFGPGPYVGVTWQGGTNLLRESGVNQRFLNKSIPMGDLVGWIPAQATVVSLQRKPLPGEVHQLAQLLGRPVLDAAVYNDDLEHMLGLLTPLEHYYAVSNTNVHLAASLGKPCTVFVPQPPEWRWMLAGDTSPWFPNVRVVRQQPGGSWPTPQGVSIEPRP